MASSSSVLAAEHSMNEFFGQAKSLHWPQPKLSISGGGAAQCRSEIGVEQAVEEVFAGFAADREASGDIRAGAEAALDGVTDRHIFVLHLFAHGDALFVAGFGGRAGVGEVVVEDHRTAIHP